MGEQVIITVDTREKDTEFINYLQRFGAVVNQEYLEVGDIAIEGKEYSLVFERKTINDFGNSISNKRLFEQIKNMCDNVEIEGHKYIPMVLLIGYEYKLYKNRGFTESQIAGIENKIEMPPPIGWGVPIIKTHNNRFAAQRLVGMARNIQTEDDRKRYGSYRNAAKSKMSTREQALYVLEGFPAIKTTRAEKILNAYGTVKDSLDAMELGIISDVDGIGPKIAERVAEVFDYTNEEE